MNLRDNYYITQNGVLKRKENSVLFVNSEGKRPIPIQKIYTIFAYGRLSFSSAVVSLLAKNGIPIHFFNYYGWYEGTFYPKEKLVSGDLLLRQAEHYLDGVKRVNLARKFVQGSLKNLIRVLRDYSTQKAMRGIDAIREELSLLETCGTISSLMGREGHARDRYYEALDSVLPEDFRMGTREKRPPSNRGNSLISFGNSLLYPTVLSEIYNTQLNPTISFLHEPYVRRFSLALDVAEIFKPIIVDKIILKLTNKRMLGDDCFDESIGEVYLSERGRKMFLEEYEKKLSTTIRHRGLGRNVSYQRLIRLELYKLEKHLIGAKEYKPLVAWW